MDLPGKTIPAFQNAESTLPASPDGTWGELYSNDPSYGLPTATGTSPVSNDFQQQFLTLNRISNLITTRSDTFTVYIVVEGWANAGTKNALLKTVHRYAFIADRSAINADPTSRFLKTLVFPND
jgi:hypothetical protein